MKSPWGRRVGDVLFLTIAGLLVAFLLIPARLLRRHSQTSAAPSRLGSVPSPNILADPLRIDRLYSGTWVSSDAGRTWEPLKDNAGRSARLLGGPHAIPPVISPDGNLLFGEVLFDEPDRPLGHGLIAHAAEWERGSWKIIAPERAEDRARPAIRVGDVAYQPGSGRPIVALDDELLGVVEKQVPGKIAAAAVTTNGTPYVAVHQEGKFSLYWMPTTDDWVPVAEARNIVDLDCTAQGIVYAAGERFGRSIAGAWTWVPWPHGFSPQRIIVHPKKSRTIAAWGRGRLLISRDGGITFVEEPLPDIEVSFAAWDPFHENTLLVINRNQDIYRVTVGW